MRSWRSKAAIVVAVPLLAGVLTVAPTTESPRAEAAVASEFDPGNLISDANFFDGDAMSASQVQSFITQRHPGCTTGYTCLPQYAQSTPSIAADAYCSAYTGSSRESAASIIAKAAAACDVSPRVLLVLLEKEQSLVTHRSPSATRYEKATGFGCPDTAPCDASVGGFFYQVYYGARQFQRYAAHPESYNHRAGVVNRILYNPNAACGSSPVLIQNQATAGLYNYTPYQPNAAALRNLYGSGDTCSAYGNRNFWRMYTDWFGDPRSGASNQLLRDTSDGKVYLIVGRARHHVPSPEILAEYTPSLGQSRDVSSSTIAAYGVGAALGRVVQGSDNAYLLVDNGSSHRFSSCNQVQAFGFDCSGLVKLDGTIQARIAAAEPMAATVVGTDGHMWLIQSSSKRELADVTLPQSYGYSADTVRLSPAALGHLRVGKPVVGAGTAVRDSSGATAVVQLASGVLRITPQQMHLVTIGSVHQFHDESIGQLAPVVGAMPTRMRSGSSAYLLTNTGVLRVDPAHYGGIARFATVADPASVLRALPGAGTETRPHFVREGATGQLYLASTNRLQAVADQSAYDFIRSRFGVPSTIWQLPVGGLANVPTDVQIGVGELVRGSDGRVLLWDGAKAMHVTHMEYVRALGVTGTIRTVSDNVVTQLPAGSALGGFGVRCGSQDLVATGGVLRPFASSAVASSWRLQHRELDPALCAQLSISTAAAEQFVVDGAGRTYILQDGKARWVPNRTILTQVGGSLERRTPMPASSIALLPKGLDVGESVPVGTWVRGSDGRVYLWDGERASYLMHPDFAAAIGIPFSVRTVSNAALASMPKGPWLGTYGIRCGSTDYVAFNGVLHRYASTSAATAWGVTELQLSAQVCSMLRVSSTSVSRFVYDSTGRTYVFERGVLRYIPTSAVYQSLGGRAEGRTLLPLSMTQRLPKGTSY